MGLSGRAFRNTFAAKAATAACAAAILLSGLSWPAASDPAVSDLNAKISGFGGALGGRTNDDGIGGIAGSISIPLAYAFGLQLDGAYANLGGDDFGSTGAHLFWRDPKIGLLGFYAGYAQLDRYGGIDVARAGAEGQYYMPNLTIDTAIGTKFIDVDQLYGRVRLQYYPAPDLMLQTGWVYEGRSFANAGIEYQFAHTKTAGASLFAEANVNDDNNYSVIGGMKITFGQDMSLKDRHRRQDPDSYAGYDILTTQQVQKPAVAAEEKCPFTPLSNLCGFASLGQRYAPRIGFVPKSLTTPAALAPSRLGQCIDAGYSSGSPGPAACGCAAAFSCAPT